MRIRRRRLHTVQRLRFGARRRLPAAVLIVCGVLLLTAALDRALSPVMASYSCVSLDREITALVNDAVLEVLAKTDLSCDSVVHLETAADGTVTALQSDMAGMAALKAALTERILLGLDGFQIRTLDIPAGNLTGLDFLSGLGPSIRARAVWFGTVCVELNSQFCEAGLNQTLHRLILQVDVPVTVLLPTGSVETTVSTSLCAAETVLLGTVPEVWMQGGGQ